MRRFRRRFRARVGRATRRFRPMRRRGYPARRRSRVRSRIIGQRL